MRGEIRCVYECRGASSFGLVLSNLDSKLGKFLRVEIADYIKVISRNFFKSNYQVDRAAIYSAEIKFNDYFNFIL